MQQATVEFDDGLIIVRFPYNAELITRIKEELQWWNRSWSQSRKAWTFTHEGWRDAEKIIEEFYEIAS
jgi:hypothetical protein